MASKRQRRRAQPVKRKAKPRKKLQSQPIQKLFLNAELTSNNLTMTPESLTQAEKKLSKPKPVSEFCAAYLAKLTKKYGTDFDQMSRDRKLNCDQLTAKKLEKMWIKLKEEREVRDDVDS